MDLYVYAIFDRKAQIYSQPFFTPNEAVAVRMLRGMVREPGTQIHSSPEDFTLYNLGTYNDLIGVFDCPKEPIPVVNAIQLQGLTTTEDRKDFAKRHQPQLEKGAS